MLFLVALNHVMWKCLENPCGVESDTQSTTVTRDLHKLGCKGLLAEQVQCILQQRSSSMYGAVKIGGFVAGLFVLWTMHNLI